MNQPQTDPITATAQDTLSSVEELSGRAEKKYSNASLWKRGIAYTIDMAIILPIYIFFFFLLTTTPVPPDERMIVATFVVMTAALLFLVSFGYFVYFEGRGGATFGKRTMKIQVISSDGTDCSITQSVVRGILRLVDIFLWPVVFFSAARLRIGDRLSKTWVVKREWTRG